MGFKTILKSNRSAILKGWTERIIHTYPPETAQFLKRQKDRFANPVGASIFEGTEHLFDQLVEGNTSGGEVSKFLDRLIRVRAIQDFTPTQAVGFIFELKDVVRGRLERDLLEPEIAAELVKFERHVDELALLAFEIFMACREKLYEVKASEMRGMFARAIERSGIFCEIPEQEEPDLA